MVSMAYITLLTDFGVSDGYPGIMKGVILTIAPEARIADITHLISPQNIHEGGLALFRSYRYFPPGTIHIAVVDPGVGTLRRPIALRLGAHYFIGPDNGLFSPVIHEALRIDWQHHYVHLNRPGYWLPNPSNVFHGRDIFAPAAAHLAAGVSLSELGDEIDDPVLLADLQPVKINSGWKGQVIAVDHFGNLSTNLTENHLFGLRQVIVRIAGREISGLVQAFGDREAGELIALIGTDHDLSISIVNGDAKKVLGIEVGVEVLVTGTPMK